jgi:predicted dehydrogenase/aryl-alcohol dehydrogenase-like predicted oxidoreductase
MAVTRQIRWGIMGPGAIAHNFADGLAEAKSGVLTAIASRNAGRLAAFGDRYEIGPAKRFASYEALVASEDIDAVYVSVPHPWHAELSILALRHGKAVLCEKPAGMNAAEVTAVTEVAVQQNAFFMEAFMYRCHPQIARLVELIRSGEIGDIQHISASFGFAAARDATSRLFDPALGGGAILDVGCYTVSIARLIAGAVIGESFQNPVAVKGAGVIGSTGVDEVARGLLVFPGSLTADIATSITTEMENAVVVTGSEGTIRLANPWVPGRDAGPSDSTIELKVSGMARMEDIRSHHHLFAFEAELASRNIAEGKHEADAPALGHADSIGNAQTLDNWRRELGYVTFNEVPSQNRRLSGTLPRKQPGIPALALDGVKLPVSRLIMGCDNKDDVASGAIVWDAFVEAGGTTFDTAFVYGGGHHETVLGQWMAARGVTKDINVIVKGGHTPYCTPRAIAAQFDISMTRLGLDFAPIYIMHRDNPGVPVGEFIDALNKLQAAGRVGIFGGSNWSPKRFAEGNAYAKRNGLKPMSVLNNNLSLAVMEKPIWDGCVTSNSPETLKFLRDNSVAHFSWSSQARGYFLPETLRNRLPADIGPELCFGSKENEKRRLLADAMAKKQGVSTHNIATAWVLAQSFPSFAIIGPRSPGEIATTLPAHGVSMSAAEAAALNLE